MDDVPSLFTSRIESQGPSYSVHLNREGSFCLPSGLFNNVASEARDHCGTISKNHSSIAANERTFLSWLRLAVVLTIVGVG